MSEPSVTDVDRLVHEPARMGILTILDGVRSADFLFLAQSLQLSNGNLSSHLAKLEAGGLITISKRFEGRTPRTSAAITPLGHEAIQAHWRRLDQLRRIGENLR